MEKIGPGREELHPHEFWVLGILIALGVGIRLWIRTPTDFWEDEIIAATHAMQPFWQLLINTVRNDVHPPLYFVQLHFWGLVSHSDVWLTLNSVLWSLAALVSLWWTVNKVYGNRMAFFATAVFAILPSPTYMADQLRMYAMLATLIIWAFYFAFISFGGERRNPRAILCLAALLIAICFTHAIGAIAVFSNGIYALGLIFQRPRGERNVRAWLAIYGITALFALPWIISGAIHDANLSGLGGAAGLLAAHSSSVIGQIAFHDPMLRMAGAIMGLSIILYGVAFRQSRLVTVAFLLIPLLLAILAELLHKPLFKWNFFSTLEAPFYAIVLAIGLTARNSRLVTFVSVGCVAAFVALNIHTRLTVRESQGFRALAETIRSNYRQGDIVFVPQPSYFGALAWYLEGPLWGSPLSIAQPPSSQWRNVYDKLGPRLVDLFGLEPQTQMLHGKNVTMLIGNDSAPQAGGAPRIWLVIKPRADLKPGYPPPELNGLTPRWTKHDVMWTTLYASSPQEITDTKSE